MKKLNLKTIVSVLVIVLLSSCKKDEPQPPEQGITEPTYPSNSLSILINAKPGSWWKYDWFKVDSLNNETLLPNDFDSIFVVGDTSINGETYCHLWRNSSMDYWDGELFYRDSAGTILDNNGNVTYSINRFNDTLISTYTDSIQTPTYYYEILMPKVPFLTTPAGNFINLYRKGLHFYYSNGQDFTPCSNSFIQSSYFSSSKGLIAREFAFSSALQNNCSYFSVKLSDYHIE